ncbi:hypothetical protein KJ693_00445 [bacterium]|nr:hypothetical protein [bacterium]MBU1613760.1 hypothetical protein [bacterium]
MEKDMKDNQLIDKKILEEIANICLDEEYETRIEVGKVVLSIKTNDYGFDRLMKKRFCTFLSSDSPELFIEIQVKEKSQIQLEKSKQVAIDDQRIFFSRNFYCAGLVDLNEKMGRVLVVPSVKDKFFESIISRVLSYFLIDFGGVLLHAASIMVDSNRGFIFCGESGCGKTTNANLSTKYTVLNDDMTLIRKINNQYKVFSTPFYRNGVNINVCAQIENLLFPRKDKEVYIKKSTVHSSLEEIMNNVFLLFQEIPFPFRGKLFNLCAEIAEKIPSYELHFLPDESFWRHILSNNIE